MLYERQYGLGIVYRITKMLKYLANRQKTIQQYLHPSNQSSRLKKDVIETIVINYYM